ENFDADLERHHHGLDLGIEVKDLPSLLAAPAGLLVAAERHRRIERAVHVDADRARPQPPRHLVGGAEIAGPYARRKAIGGAVRFLGNAIEIIVAECHRAQDRPEDLLAHDGHLRLGLSQDGRCDEITFVADAAAAGHHFGAILAALRYIARDAVELLL